MKKLPPFIIASLLAISISGLSDHAWASKSGWIDGEQDEIKLPTPGYQQQYQQNQPGRAVGDMGSGDMGGENTATPPPATSGRGYQAADSGQPNDPSMGAGSPVGEGAMDAAGNELGSMDDLDHRPVETPRLKIGEGGSHVISGGVSSANFRSARTINRGTDAGANVILQQAPFLPIPRTVSVQPSTFKGWLDSTHAGEASTFGKTTIVEIKGQWDDCGHIIHNFGLPFTRISPAGLTRADLSKTKIMVVNCGANFDADSLSVIRDFVAHGGFLMTTDWALDSCLQKAFPGYVEWNSGYTDNSVVDAVVVDRDPELTKGLPRVGSWKLEDKSQTVQVIRKMEVQVLVRSRVLMQREPSQLGILALTFPYGDGQVLHLVGHFDNNADRASNSALPDPAPIIGIGLRQAIAANFIMAAGREGGRVSAPTAKAEDK